MDWIKIIENDYSTYPKEGYSVIVSDEKNNYDVAWYLMSSEYKWVKDDLINDDLIDFKSFIIIKWSYIN
jgi:hypothetical protein